MAFNSENYLRPQEDYLQMALREFNKDTDGNKQNWYGWKKEDDEGNKIPNNERMQHQYIKVIVEGAVIPSKADLDAKMEELRNADKTNLEHQNSKALSGKQKLKDLGLDDEEIAQIYPCGTCPDCIGS